MLSKIICALDSTSKRLLSLAEVFLWCYVAIGVIDMCYGGISSPSSVAVSCYVVTTVIAVVICASSFIFELIKNKGSKNGSDK